VAGECTVRKFLLLQLMSYVIILDCFHCLITQAARETVPIIFPQSMKL
jgi:hypothetical protein